MVKKIMPFNVESRVLVLAKHLGINRSAVAEEALKAKIAAKLKTRKTDLDSLEALAMNYQIEEKVAADSIELEIQRHEQEIYMKEQEKLHRQFRELDIIMAFREVCKESGTREDQLCEYIMGESDQLQTGPFLEICLLTKFEEKGLPRDLNILRPLLVKSFQVIR